MIRDEARVERTFVSAARVTRVLVADDHAGYRSGIARAIAEHPDLVLVAEAEDGQTALDLTRALAPDVALLDVRMPKLLGIDVLRAITDDQGTSTRVVLLSGHAPEHLVLDAIDAGARGFIDKATSRAEICDAILTVAAGQLVVDEHLVAALAARAPERQPGER